MQLYKVTINFGHSLIGNTTIYWALASSGHIAASFALAKAKKDWAEEKNPRVSTVEEFDGEYIGKAG